MPDNAPRVPAFGTTGRTGAAVADALDAPSEQVVAVCVSRSKETLVRRPEDGKEAVCIELDEPGTFPEVQKGIGRAFLVAGYAVVAGPARITHPDGQGRRPGSDLGHIHFRNETEQSDVNSR